MWNTFSTPYISRAPCEKFKYQNIVRGDDLSGSRDCCIGMQCRKSVSLIRRKILYCIRLQVCNVILLGGPSVIISKVMMAWLLQFHIAMKIFFGDFNECYLEDTNGINKTKRAVVHMLFIGWNLWLFLLWMRSIKV